jgi:hypothetical protein
VCVRGASALDAVLKRHANVRVRVFTVWQPILATDFTRPVTPVLGRLSDSRVQQYWDPAHLVATQMGKDARAPQPEPECCERSGILWDVAAVYPAGVMWDDRMPPAKIFNGPVVDITSAIEEALASSGRARRSTSRTREPLVPPFSCLIWASL